MQKCKKCEIEKEATEFRRFNGKRWSTCLSCENKMSKQSKKYKARTGYSLAERRKWIKEQMRTFGLK